MESALEKGSTCKHGVPLVSRLDGPSAYCATCDEAFLANPRYYADGLHLTSDLPSEGTNS